MQKALKSIWDNISGATAIEYGLIAALIGVIIISAATALGGGISGTMNAKRPAIVQLLPDGTCPTGYARASVARSVDTRDTVQVKPQDVCAR